ncbi:ABC transporter permease [soil metagenome]
MLRNYFKIAIRNLRKNGLYSAINIGGLSIGITCCILIALYVQYEVSYDRFQEKGDRIARVIMEYSINGGLEKGNFTSTKVATALQDNFPEVKTAVRMFQTTQFVKRGTEVFKEKNFLYADSTFFSTFRNEPVYGNLATFLPGPGYVVLTESTSKKYFGNADPIGKTIQFASDKPTCLVSGVIKDYPANSQLKFDFISSFSSMGTLQNETYWNANYTTYLLLKDHAAIAPLEAKLVPFMKKEMATVLTGNDYMKFILEPFQDIHLRSEFDAFTANSSITYIYIISAVAFLILLIACFTYINLSTARSIERAKEVGIRKVSGAIRREIFIQFISESVLLAAFAMVLSFILVFLTLPAFNSLAQKNLLITDLLSPYIISLIVFILISISFFSGSYPALILSGYRPSKVLKGIFKNSESGVGLRKSLIIFQFVVSVLLIISALVIQEQLKYIRNKKLGYEREHVLVLPAYQKIANRISLLKSSFKSNPEILNVSLSTNEPVNIQSGYTIYRDETPAQSVLINGNVVDDEFVKVIGAKIIAGSDLSAQDVSDVTDKAEQEVKQYHFIINETASKKLGFAEPKNAIGQKVSLGEGRPGIIKGVVNDFHFSSLHNPIEPLVLFPESWPSYILVRISGRHIPETIAFMKSKWTALAPDRPFEYNFLDEDYLKQYQSEIRFGSVLNIFTLIAILLATAGLIGLSAFAVLQRTKEIGIRKILGASIGNITLLLSKDFIKLICISILIASPLAWMACNKWLEDFAFRITISWWFFGIAAAFALLAAFLTVSTQTLRAAISNPVKSLRSE